jgi:adenosine/AMP kinase
MDLKLVKINKPDEQDIILGQTHFIKSVEDIHEAMVNSVPGIKFGIGFCEASQKCLVRCSGNDDTLVELAKQNALELAAGHTFIVFIKDAFPIHVLRAIKQVPEVCNIYCATSNPVQVVIAESPQGRGILGVIDGLKSKGIETEADIVERKEFLRKIGYKL